MALQDPVLPGVAIAFDVERMRDRMRESLPECRNGLGLERVRIDDVQYKPRESCVILYNVKFRHPDSGRSEAQMLSAVLVPDGRWPAPPGGAPGGHSDP